MKLLVRGISSSIKGLSYNPIYSIVTATARKSLAGFSSLFKSANNSMHFTPHYKFSSQEPPKQQPPSSSSLNIKLLQIKSLFQTQMNKYNLKGLLKMYKVLKHNSIALSEQSLRKFQQRLNTQLTQIDHESVNSLLEMMKRNGQSYQIKGKNKLLRGINLKLQKNKLAFQPTHIYKTIKLITEMNFPKSTISRVLFKLVQQNEPEKRQLHMVDNLSEFKIVLLAVETVEMDLEIKRRVMENFILIKPKGVVELAYFYSVLKTLVNRLEESVLYEAQKKSVYELAFNPYRNYEENQGNEETKPNPIQQPSITTSPPQINPTIMKQLLEQKQKLLQETFKKIDLQQVSTQLFNQLTQTTNPKSQDALEWREMKQLCLLLIGNRFGEEGKERRELVGEMVVKVVKEGMEEGILIRLPEFIILMQEMKELGQNKSVQQYLSKYSHSYYEFMNLEQKLMFTYHKSKLTNSSIDLTLIKNQLNQLNYGLDAQQFVWLNKVLLFGQEKHSVQEKHLVKEIWTVVEGRLDSELEGLERERREKERREGEEKEERKRQEEELKNSNKQDKTEKVNQEKNQK